MDRILAAGAQGEVQTAKWAMIQAEGGTVAEKECTGCGRVKASSKFRRDSTGGNGLRVCGSNPAHSHISQH